MALSGSIMTPCTENTKGGSTTVRLTSSLTGLDKSVVQIRTTIVSCHTANSKPVKQEVSGTMILPLLVFPALYNEWHSVERHSAWRDPTKWQQHDDTQHCDAQHYYIHHNDTCQNHNDSQHMTLIIMTLVRTIMTLSIMTLNKMAFSLTTLSIIAFWHTLYWHSS